MLRKIIIGLLVIASFVAISYLKTSREAEQKDSAYQKGQKDSEKAADNFRQDIDSLTEKINAQQLAFVDSISSFDKLSKKQSDSLSIIVKEQDKEISNLRKKIRTNQTNAQTKKTISKTLSKHEKIFLYYKKRYAALPKDLSTYEKKIALNEIREETTEKFSISLSELEKIRKDNKLNY